MICGFGWREAWGRLASAEGRKETAIILGLLVAIYAAYLGTAQTVLRSSYAAFTWGRNIKLEPFIHGYGLSLILAAALFLWALGRMRRRAEASPAMLICALVAFGAFHWREAFQVGEGFADYVVRPAKRTDLFAKSPTIEAILEHKEAPSRVIGFHNDLLPGWSIVYGIEGISGPDALMNPYYREFMGAAGINRIWDWRYIVEPVEVARFKPAFDLLDARYYVGYHLGTNRPGKEVEEVLSADMDTYESKSVWPRAFFTDSVAVYKDVGQYASWIYAGDGRPFAGIQLSDWISLVPSPNVSGDLGKRQVSAAENYHLTTNTTAFTVKASGPGFIVLTEAYEKDNFQATLNGKRVPYFRINHAFKGIYVDSAGTYQVKFAYWPSGLSTALVVSAVGFLLIALALVTAVRGSRSESAAS